MCPRSGSSGRVSKNPSRLKHEAARCHAAYAVRRTVRRFLPDAYVLLGPPAAARRTERPQVEAVYAADAASPASSLRLSGGSIQAAGASARVVNA